MGRDTVIVSCEHGGNEVPPAYAALFAGHDDLLATHRGWDMGALELAGELAAALKAPLFAATTTRLLIDLNRSIGHRQLHSELTRGLSAAARREIAALHYTPYRQKLEAEVADCIARGERVIHVASHSFTPEMAGVVRQADVSLLYDPSRAGERACAAQWLAALRSSLPGLRLRRNYPYEGKADGVMSVLRRRHADDVYVGIELEVNQRFVSQGGAAWLALRHGVVQALRAATSRI